MLNNPKWWFPVRAEYVAASARQHGQAVLFAAVPPPPGAPEKIQRLAMGYLTHMSSIKLYQMMDRRFRKVAAASVRRPGVTLGLRTDAAAIFRTDAAAIL